MILKKPFVSISVTTFNQKNYIKDCLDGILNQRTTFQFEIILGEDQSNDGTREVCQDYAKRYPEKIKLFLRSRKDVIYINGNATGRYNFLENLKACRGKYIALCEGDDYWTDPLKLQKQVDFLEANEDYAICFHDVLEFHQNTSFFKDDYMSMHNKETHFDSLKIARGNFIHTPSVVLRNDFEIPNWFLEVVLGDWSLYLLQLKGRKIKRFKEKMAVYRVHDQGVWTKKEGYESERDMALTAKIILDNLQLSSEVISALQEFYNQHYNAYILAKGNGLSQLKRYIKKNIKFIIGYNKWQKY